MNKCIWCKKSISNNSEEHIIPESLGCPENFVLLDSICNSCNNKLGHLDKAVIDEFDILKFLQGIPTKKGKKPSISSRGNLVGNYSENEKSLFFNADTNPIKINETRVGGIGKSDRNIKFKFKHNKETADISFSTKIGENPKFIRGILKIAFSSLAYFIEKEEVLEDKYNSIRNFVTKGKGQRKILLKSCNDNNFINRVWEPYVDDMNNYLIVVRLAFLEFAVDLSPDMSSFKELKDKSYDVFGDSGWTFLPIN